MIADGINRAALRAAHIESRSDVSLALAVAPAWPAEPVDVAQSVTDFGFRLVFRLVLSLDRL